MRIAAVTAALAFVVAATAVRAATVDELFAQFGMYGTWSPDCTLAPALHNPHVTVAKQSDGTITEDSDQGPGYQHNRYSFVSAQRLSETELSVDVVFEPGTPAQERQRLVFLVHDGTRRTMVNQPEGGAMRVNNGIAVTNGNPTPVLNKCK